jgi:hypothetical protein
MKNRISIIAFLLLIGIFSIFPVLKASDFDNILIAVDVGKAYPVLTIKDTLGIGNELAKIDILENTEQCLINCHSIINITTYRDYNLPSLFNFIDKQGLSKEVASYKTYLKGTEVKDEERQHYKDDCTKKVIGNGTIEDCVLVNDYNYTVKISQEVWNEYKGEVLTKGSYSLKLSGEKKPTDSIDWSFSYMGISDSEFRKYIAWWDSDWTRRKYIKIQDLNNSNVLNYSQLLAITYDTDMQVGFDDLRFVDDSQTIELGHFFENITNSTSAKVWVHLLNLSSGLNTSIYMFYGNPIASSTSNFKKAFIYGDDFSTNTTNQWAAQGTGNFHWDETTQRLILNHSAASNYYIYPQTSDQRINKSYTLESAMNLTGKDAEKYFAFNLYRQNIISTTGYMMGEVSTKLSVQDWGVVIIKDSLFANGEGGLYIYKFDMGYGKINASAFLTDGTLVSNVNVSNHTKYQQGYYGTRMYMQAGAGIMRLNWFRVRPHIEIEPSYVIGSEEFVLDTTNPSVVFNAQVPPDLTDLNAFGVGLNITFNISDNVAINTSTVVIYHKTNKSSSDITYSVNGTDYKGYFLKNYNSNLSSTFLFRLSDNEVYPATYNFDEKTMESMLHNMSSLSTVNTKLKINLLNVSNATQYNFFEIMMNKSSAIGSSSNIYFCNSSYGSGIVSSSNFCVLIYSLAPTVSYNHSHTGYSKHQVIPFFINVTTGKVSNTIEATPSSYFVFTGANTNVWNFYFIDNITRLNATQTTTNKGINWDAFNGTVDAHLHQYNGTDRFYYYVCANDSSDNQNCSSVYSDLIELGGIPPSSPSVYRPINGTYNTTIYINYTQSFSPNEYPITYYNITLLNFDFTYNLTIRNNNTVNLSYIWDISTVQNGTYIIKVTAYDNLSQSSSGFSADFVIDNSPTNAKPIEDNGGSAGAGEISYPFNEITLFNFSVSFSSPLYFGVEFPLIIKTFDKNNKYVDVDIINLSSSTTTNYTKKLFKSNIGQYRLVVNLTDNNTKDFNFSISVNQNTFIITKYYTVKVSKLSKSQELSSIIKEQITERLYDIESFVMNNYLFAIFIAGCVFLIVYLIVYARKKNPPG